MALFKILKGLKANLPSTKVEGQVYLTTDEMKLYFDVDSSTRKVLNADKADSLKVSAAIGSSTQPVYFNAEGKPVAIGYTIAKSVPSNAVFTDTTYSAATSGAAGLMSAADKQKLDGIASGANAYSLPVATSSKLGGVMAGGDISISSTGVMTVNDNSHAHTMANITDLPSWVKDNTSGKPAYTAADVGAIASNLKGANNGVAELDANGKVPASQLPSYVDDVLEGYLNGSTFYAKRSGTTGSYSYSEQIAAESGKIYVDLSNNKTYRYSGSTFTEISASLALGETSGTAYRGDRGKVAYDHAVAKGVAVASGLYKITTNAEGHVTAATAVTKSDIDNLVGNASSSANGLMTSAQVNKLSGIASGAEVNQNAFSNVKVTQGTSSTTLAADSKTDTFSIIAGANVTLTADANGDSITIASKDTTYSAATTSVAGLMSVEDKKKLDGISAGANAYTLPAQYSATVTGTNAVKVNSISAPTADGSSTYGAGAAGNVLKSNGTTVYWDADNDSNVQQSPTSSNASYPLLLAPNGQAMAAITQTYFDSGVTLNPSTNTIAANISGKAASSDGIVWGSF